MRVLLSMGAPTTRQHTTEGVVVAYGGLAVGCRVLVEAYACELLTRRMGNASCARQNGHVRRPSTRAVLKAGEEEQLVSD